jgi:hypothetical protein
MSVIQIATLAACLVISFVVIFAIVGGLNWGGSMLVQAVCAAVAAAVGLLAGNWVYARFLPGR